MILNLTQHPATLEQIDAGVIDLQGEQLVELKTLLTFNELPTLEEIEERAERIAIMAYKLADLGCDKAMIGGAPFLMSALEKALLEFGYNSVFAFSKRESVEKTLEDGSVVKTNAFKHIGFVGL